MTKLLLHVAEGILDSAAEEYRAINLASADAVQDYAEACNIELTGEESETILQACKNWIDGASDGSLNGTNDYYHTVIKPLVAYSEEL